MKPPPRSDSCKIAPAVEIAAMDLQTEMDRINRAQDEVRRFCADTRKPEPTLWLFVAGGSLLGATLFGLGMMFERVIGV